MNNFYSANGDISNYNIIEHFETPTEGVSVIAHLLESENQKNKINELENKVKELTNKFANIDIKINNKMNDLKKYLPYNNDRFSTIDSKRSNEWNSEENNLFIEIEFKNTYHFIPNVYTELILNKDYKLKFKKRIANLSKNGFRLYMELIDFNFNYQQVNVK